MKARLVYSCLATAYYLSWAWFAGVGVILNLLCVPLLLLPRRERLGPAMRGVIRGLFSVWLHWFHLSRCLRICWRGFDTPLTPRTIYVANHPTLLDATFLLARLPDTICIIKPALMRSPAIGPLALLAGYAAGGTDIDLIRDVAGRVATGRSLLVFPEGTRTKPGTMLGTLKPGYALIAGRARAAVQLIIIRASADLVPRGRPWWRPPAVLPAWAELTLDRRWEYDPARRTRDLTAEVERRLSEVLAGMHHTVAKP
jgi:1-acyl-sn-glycerol-3-phosphate acyltransferase